MAGKKVKVVKRNGHPRLRQVQSYGAWNLFSDDNPIEITYSRVTPYQSIVRCEQPDKKWGFKVFECEVPSIRIIKSVGYSNLETMTLIAFCRDNAEGFLEDEDE